MLVTFVKITTYPPDGAYVIANTVRKNTALHPVDLTRDELQRVLTAEGEFWECQKLIHDKLAP